MLVDVAEVSAMKWDHIKNYTTSFQTGLSYYRLIGHWRLALGYRDPEVKVNMGHGNPKLISNAQ